MGNKPKTVADWDRIERERGVQTGIEIERLETLVAHLVYSVHGPEGIEPYSPAAFMSGEDLAGWYAELRDSQSEIDRHHALIERMRDLLEAWLRTESVGDIALRTQTRQLLSREVS